MNVDGIVARIADCCSRPQVGDEAVVRYLARYVFRLAITNNHIVDSLMKCIEASMRADDYVISRLTETSGLLALARSCGGPNYPSLVRVSRVSVRRLTFSPNYSIAAQPILQHKAAQWRTYAVETAPAGLSSR
jgi:hypothetical protein